jgi:lipopolysaccharide export system permease protein
MRILTRYVIRAHIGPFIFAFTALTGLIFLNAVAQRLDTLVGRGLGPAVIAEFALLSLPHVVALTLPMSILVATLYAFADLTGNNEVTAISAGGIHPARLIAPLIGVGLVLGAVVFVFNDRVLPEANSRLSSLLSDISSKSPTFQLREEVVNEIHTGDNSRYFLRARQIDPVTQELEDVTIFDLSGLGESRTITAEHGRMEVTPDGLDLYLHLENGKVLEVQEDDPKAFQRLSYETHVLPLKGIFQELERQAGGGLSDREMTIAMLQEEVVAQDVQLQSVVDEAERLSLAAVDLALRGVSPVELMASPALVAVGGGVDATGNPIGGSEILPANLPQDVASVHRIIDSRWEVYRLSAARYLVEIHKKYAIAFACIVFLLLGPPLALRFPRGGVGMVIAASVAIFFLYWVGLIVGEELGDGGQVNPLVAMWAPNAILLVWALLLLRTVADHISTNRSTAWSELRHRLRRPFARAGRRRSAPTAEAA